MRRPSMPIGTRLQQVRLVLASSLALLVLLSAAPRARTTAGEAAPSDHAADAPAEENNGGSARPAYTTESLRGQVVWLADALRRHYGIETDSDAEHWIVALETPEGELYPLVKDGRGRGFLLDPRMRDIDMELLVRRFEGSPMVQVIQVYTLKPDGKYEFDYWCDICAIPMYELKPCECCQQEIRIRQRLVEPGDGPPAGSP